MSAKGLSPTLERGQRVWWESMVGRAPLSFAVLLRCGRISSVRSAGGRSSRSRSRWRSRFPIRTSPRFTRRSRSGVRGCCRPKRRTRCERPWIRSSSFFAAWGATRRRLLPLRGCAATSAAHSPSSRVCDFLVRHRSCRAPRPLRSARLGHLGIGCEPLVGAAGALGCGERSVGERERGRERTRARTSETSERRKRSEGEEGEDEGEERGRRRDKKRYKEREVAGVGSPGAAGHRSAQNPFEFGSKDATVCPLLRCGLLPYPRARWPKGLGRCDPGTRGLG